MKKRVKVRISSSKVYLYETSGTGPGYHYVLIPCGSTSNPGVKIDCYSPGSYCVKMPCGS